MKNKIIIAAVFLASLVGCASNGSVPSTDPRYSKMTECGGDLVLFITSDSMLKLRVENNLRTGQVPASIQSKLKNSFENHPSAAYAKLLAGDIGMTGITKSLDSKKKVQIADMMANAELKFGDDKIKALQEVVPKLAETAQSSCKEAGYSFTAIKPVSPIFTDERPNLVNTTPSVPQQSPASPKPEATVATQVSSTKKQNSELQTTKKIENNAADRQAVISARKASKSERAQLISSVDSVLKDSESARYADMDVIPKKYACVSVNAKNSFGGYIGFSSMLMAYISNTWIYILKVDEQYRCNKVMTSMAVKNS